jgi:DNA mismatch repair protein MutS
MMRQYAATKAEAGDALLLFRMGDFYELFFDDAKAAAQLLGLALTSREKGPNAIPMAGFPHHSLDMHLARLLRAGKRVAICEQVEDAKHAVGLVKREITRIVTPGTLTDDTLLDPRRNNFLAAVALGATQDPRARLGVAWTDLSSGRLLCADWTAVELDEELARLEPTECLIPEGTTPGPGWSGHTNAPVVTFRPNWTFQSANARTLLARHFKVATFTGFGVDDDSPSVSAAGALLAYLQETQRTGLAHISRLEPYDRGALMILDPVTRRSLELTRAMRDNGRDGTLFAALDDTVTAAGARCLADWIHQPLRDPQAIRYRQAAVAEWKDDPASRRELRELLRRSFDIERLVSRIGTGRTSPRDLGALRTTLRLLPAVKARLAARVAAANADLEERLDILAELRQQLEMTLVDDPPLSSRDGGIIRDGTHTELDELRETARGGKRWIAELQRTEIQRSGIANLKVGFNKVFGYYIEVPNSSRNKVPGHYHRKQTLKNAERYVTPELKEHEQKVLTAQDRADELEFELFCRLRDAVAQYTLRLQELARALAQLDCLAGLAELASRRQYVRPAITDTMELNIEAGRHPVLETVLPPGRFVPNDALLCEDERFLLITGPNMAGKSTYIRQVALITLMAQIGSFVPATSATIGVVDRIFTRVGANDELARGQSTFMVEMAETANILHNATGRSLVILDEIGRGTSTYDGVSLAWAIAERLHDVVGCRTLFATHYHELIELQPTLAAMRNYNAAVREWQNDVVFLHQILPGGADRSYGIHVAQLAGVPREVLQRAQQILERLEQDPFGERDGRLGRPRKHRRTYHQLSLFPNPPADPVISELRQLDLTRLTPQEALAQVARWRQQLEGEA